MERGVSQFETPATVSVVGECPFSYKDCESATFRPRAFFLSLPPPSPLRKNSGFRVEEESASATKRPKAEFACSGQSLDCPRYFVPGPLIWLRSGRLLFLYFLLVIPFHSSRIRLKLWASPFRSLPLFSPSPRFPASPHPPQSSSQSAHTRVFRVLRATSTPWTLPRPFLASLQALFAS